MSYAQKPTFAEELEGRVGDALSRWAHGLAFNLRLSLRLCGDGLRRVIFKPRTIKILDIQANGDRLQPVRMSVIPKADAWPRGDSAGIVPPPPLP
jgi:hypothetical protein